MMDKMGNRNFIVGTGLVAIITALMLIATAAPLAAEETTVGVSPTMAQGNTRVKVTFSVTNGTGENIDNILIRPATGTFSEAIGGKSSADSLLLAGDNMENAAPYVEMAGENLKLAAENKDNAGSDLVSAASLLEETADLGDTALGADWDGAWGPMLDASYYLELVGENLKAEPEDLSQISSLLQSVADELEESAGNVPPENDDVKDNMTDAAAALGAASVSLDNGSLASAADNVQEAGSKLEAAGVALEQMTTGKKLESAGESVGSAGKQLRATANYIGDASTALEDAYAFLWDAGFKVSQVTNLGDAGVYIKLAATGIQKASEDLENTAAQDVFGAGSHLGNAAGFLDDASVILGKALGKSELAPTADHLSVAAENLSDREAVDLTTAGDGLIEAASDLSSAASTITSTAGDLSPANWALTEGTPEEDDVFFSAIGENENWMQPGETLDFTFIWKSGSEDTTFTVWGSKVGASLDPAIFGPIEVEIGVDTTKPSLSTLVTQEGVAEDDLVGTEYDDGKATLTITASEELENIGPITLEDEDNLIPPITRSDLSTTDNVVFTYEFTVENWDDNSPVDIEISSATDLFKNENEPSEAVGSFHVDTRAPVIINSGIGIDDLGLENKAQAGTNNVYLTDNYAEKTILGRAEDNADNRLGYDNDLVTTVLEVRFTWGGKSVAARRTPLDNFIETITLDEGLNPILTVEVTDWTGNSTSENIENVMIDTTPPSVSLDSVAGVSWDENEELISNDSPAISLTLTDAGLGVAYDNLEVLLDNDDNYLNGAGYWTLDNANPYVWDAAAGSATWENTIDNAGEGLVDGTYWITGYVSDNIAHDGSMDVYFARSFTIDATAPTFDEGYLAETSALKRSDGTLINIGTRAVDEKSLIMTGTAKEAGSTIEIYNQNDTLLGSVTLGEDETDWRTTIDLESCYNDIYVQETDLAGNTSEKVFFRGITADEEPPSIELSSETAALANTETGQSSVKVKATITDTCADYKDIDVSLRSPQYDVPEGYATLSPDGTIQVTIPLREGNNKIDIVAKDQVRNTAVESFVIKRTVTPWAVYAAIAAIIAIILAAIAVIRIERT